MTIDETPTNHPDAPGAAPIVRSEEQIRVSLPVRVRGGIRIRKHVVTETITQTIQVRREELSLDEVTADDLVLTGDPAASGTYQLRDGHFDVILHEERIVTSTQVVPVERVRVHVKVVTDHVTVTEPVRREHVELLSPPPSAAG